MSMPSGRIEIPFGAQNIIIETGKIAKQANAAVTVTYGETIVLVAVCMAKQAKEGAEFFPLMVEYQEKMYSAGRIPGGFFKREGRPTQKEVLTSRLIDRPIRPLFPNGFLNDVQVVATVLSSDGKFDPDLLAIIGASAALTISDIPFAGPIGAVRIGLVGNEFVLNPSYEERDISQMDLVVVGFKDSIIMIEGEAQEIPEAKIEEALKYALKEIKVIHDLQLKFREQVGRPKVETTLFNQHPDLKPKIKELIHKRLEEAYRIADKQKRENAQGEIINDLVSDLSIFEAFKVGNREVKAADVKTVIDEIEYEHVRTLIFEKNKRADGRGTKDIRDISCEVHALPRTHGSSLFTRGQTQSLAVVTLGTKRDEQLIEALDDVTYENFMLHYNFPSFSVGEAKPMRAPGRREIGHGALAAKALRYILPSKENFPYTIRIVSEILESNGSSSMASVCSGCLSLMDAGVPIKDMVAGISIGLVTNGKDYRLLTDIMGLEDHFGDMDFKVAGTENGITAIQLDLKIQGVAANVLAEGLTQAKAARSIILSKMRSVIDKPKDDISQYAPRIIIMQIPQEKIGEVIGPGGKMIKRIIEETGVEAIDIEDDGKVVIASLNRDSAEKAAGYLKGLVEVPEVGRIYDAKVERIVNFGAFCEFLPGRLGLVHVSEIAEGYVKDVSSVLKIGDKIKVKVIEIDQMNRINLSKKQAEKELASK